MPIARLSKWQVHDPSVLTTAWSRSNGSFAQYQQNSTCLTPNLFDESEGRVIVGNCGRGMKGTLRLERRDIRYVIVGGNVLLNTTKANIASTSITFIQHFGNIKRQVWPWTRTQTWKSNRFSRHNRKTSKNHHSRNFKPTYGRHRGSTSKPGAEQLLDDGKKQS